MRVQTWPLAVTVAALLSAPASAQLPPPPPPPRDGLEIEMTNRVSDVSGVVTNPRGEAVKEYSLVVFARDRELWGPNSRFIRTGRPDQDGRYKIVGLPAGSYYAVAVDYIDPSDDPSDPEFLDRLRGKAAAFSVSEGDTKTLDLKITTAS